MLHLGVDGEAEDQKLDHRQKSPDRLGQPVLEGKKVRQGQGFLPPDLGLAGAFTVKRTEEAEVFPDRQVPLQGKGLRNHTHFFPHRFGTVSAKNLKPPRSGAQHSRQ